MSVSSKQNTSIQKSELPRQIQKIIPTEEDEGVVEGEDKDEDTPFLPSEEEVVEGTEEDDDYPVLPSDLKVNPTFDEEVAEKEQDQRSVERYYSESEQEFSGREILLVTADPNSLPSSAQNNDEKQYSVKPESRD